MLEDFSAAVEQEGEVGEKAFERPEQPEDKETPPVTPTENKPTEKPSQGGDNTPVATSPSKTLTPRQQREESRWQKAQEELRELRKWKEETATKLLEREPVASAIPEWFPKSGNAQTDAQKYKEYLSYESGVKAQIKQDILEDQSREAQAKTAEAKKWSEWVEDSLDKLEDEGKTFDRKELQAVALKYLPSDKEGNIDFGKAYEIMTELKKVNTAPQAQRADARKRVGDLTNTSRSTAETAKPKFETQRSLRNRSFDQLIRETN
jgi:hypothetical protein